ncbi:MAG: DUF5522 domain-containing protein [Pirellulales bacterium]
MDGDELPADQIARRESGATPAPLVAGVDYYLERGCLVFTREYHLKRGYCCQSGCRHCPYGNAPQANEPA